MIIRCCYGCEDRAVGCHSTCKQYIKEKSEWADAKNNRDKQVALDSVLKRKKRYN